MASGSKDGRRPLSRFPLRGEAGAGGVPPRRQNQSAPPTSLGRAMHPQRRGCPSNSRGRSGTLPAHSGCREPLERNLHAGEALRRRRSSNPSSAVGWIQHVTQWRDLLTGSPATTLVPPPHYAPPLRIWNGPSTGILPPPLHLYPPMPLCWRSLPTAWKSSETVFIQ